MLARLSLLALCACLAAAPAYAKDKPAAFSCTGVFGPDSSEALLKQTYGAENVVTGMVDGAEGEQMLATTVFPKNPEKSMEFGWQNDDTRERLGFVYLPPSMSGPHGLRVGMSVDDVVAINGKPFTIGGFWWDYGGGAQIETGALANGDDDKSCFLSLAFVPNDDYPQDLDVSAVSGEVSIPTDEPLLKKLGVHLSQISISYAYPEGDVPAE
ncbi:hypothetical protein [Devosia sp.]|uniref:hypothetical protein n=1 Tax=Devosia sp. TaxID=1871048 RepID=UPI003264E41D